MVLSKSKYVGIIKMWLKVTALKGRKVQMKGFVFYKKREAQKYNSESIEGFEGYLLSKYSEANVWECVSFKDLVEEFDGDFEAVKNSFDHEHEFEEAMERHKYPVKNQIWRQHGCGFTTQAISKIQALKDFAHEDDYLVHICTEFSELCELLSNAKKGTNSSLIDLVQIEYDKIIEECKDDIFAKTDNTLATHRARSGLGQEEFANLLGIGVTTLRKYEKDDTLTPKGIKILGSNIADNILKIWYEKAR